MRDALKKIAIVGTGAMYGSIARLIAKMGLENDIELILVDESSMEDAFSKQLPFDQEYILTCPKPPELKSFGVEKIKPTCKKYHEYIATEVDKAGNAINTSWKCKHCQKSLLYYEKD